MQRVELSTTSLNVSVLFISQFASPSLSFVFILFSSDIKILNFSSSIMYRQYRGPCGENDGSPPRSVATRDVQGITVLFPGSRPPHGPLEPTSIGRSACSTRLVPVDELQSTLQQLTINRPINCMQLVPYDQSCSSLQPMEIDQTMDSTRSRSPSPSKSGLQELSIGRPSTSTNTTLYVRPRSSLSVRKLAFAGLSQHVRASSAVDPSRTAENYIHSEGPWIDGSRGICAEYKDTDGYRTKVNDIYLVERAPKVAEYGALPERKEETTTYYPNRYSLEGHMQLVPIAGSWSGTALQHVPRSRFYHQVTGAGMRHSARTPMERQTKIAKRREIVLCRQNLLSSPPARQEFFTRTFIARGKNPAYLRQTCTMSDSGPTFCHWPIHTR